MKQKINELVSYLNQMTRRTMPKDINVTEFPEELRGLAEGVREAWEYTEGLEQRLEKLEHKGLFRKEQKCPSDLLEKLIEILADWIVVLDETQEEPLFKNREYFFPQFETGVLEKSLLERLRTYNYDEMGPVWDIEGIMGKDFRVESFAVSAEEQTNIVAHRLRDITAEKLYVNKLEQSVYYDPETKLYNRRFCNETLEKWLKEKQNFSVCFVDLDHLKYVNDTLGHKEGDRYIKSVVEGLKKTFRESDYICRVGGDEMVILLHECSEEMAQKRCRAAQERVEAAEGETVNKYPMGFSFGVTTVSQPCASRKEDVLNKADKNMYTNKSIRHKEIDRRWKEYRKSNFF